MSEQWPREQAIAWAQGQTWRFTSYYKYSFYFEAEVHGTRGAVCAGGNTADIYRWTVNPEMKWQDILGGGGVYLSIGSAAGGEVFGESLQ